MPMEKRPRAHDQPVEISKLKIHKASYSDRNSPIEEVKNAFFDPRHLNDRAPISEEDKTDFARKLHQINPDACALEFLLLPEIQDVHEKVNKSAVPLNIITKANNFLKENPYISNTDELSSKLFENLKFSCEEISNIQEMTLGQSENKCWFEMR